MKLLRENIVIALFALFFFSGLYPSACVDLVWPCVEAIRGDE